MSNFSNGSKNTTGNNYRPYNSSSSAGRNYPKYKGTKSTPSSGQGYSSSNNSAQSSTGYPKSSGSTSQSGGFRNNGGNSYGQNRSRGGYQGGYKGGRGNGGNRRGRQSYHFDEAMFVRKTDPNIEVVEYVASFSFEELDIHKTLKRNIQTKNFNVPTPIQDKCIPHVINKMDLLGIANTGTGKTAAFLIPLIDKVVKNRDSRVLVITPTRELADQINQDLYSLTRDLGIYSVQCIGGNNIRNQIYQLQRGYDFVIGTAGRLKDLYDRKVLDLSSFDTIVLDEVDRMLDMGFVNEIKHLISFLPAERQSLCFSATVDRKVEEIIQIILKENYVKISVKTGETANNIDQDIVRINSHDDKIPKLEELLSTEGFDKVLVFVNTKRQVDKLDKHLYSKGYQVTSIHGERRQNERKRSMDSFKSGRSKILIATDVAARGLDISNVTHVINFDIPMSYEDYIHRVGRTGRANKKGLALTFVENQPRRY